MTPQESQWLDRLLSLDAPDRQRELATLEASQPELHARLLGLLRHAAVTSQVFMRPILGALDHIVEKARLVHQAGDSLAGYRLLRQLGHGGMSTVWLAERLDGVIKRTVALKLPLYVLTAPADIARFAREKDVLAGLAHPHIARLYDAGVTDAGQPFIVLEFVDGVPITAYCDEHRLGIRERLHLFLQALAAVADAHRHLIVHLDIKPSNILVDADGQVKLLDFGISKLLTEPAAGRNLEPDAPGAGTPQASEARATSMAMTALYAAPEQVLGMPLSTSTDVYALGVLLHELLTGGSPYLGLSDATPFERILELITTGDITRPSRSSLTDAAANLRGIRDVRRLRARLSGDLDAVVQLAMRQETAERYRSVEAFADDLRRLLADRPVEARPHAWGHAAHLFLKRHLAASIAAGIGIVLSVVAASAALQQYHDARANEARAVLMLDFLLGMANNAEPDESQRDAEVTGKQMISAAVQTARSQFEGQPRLRAELLGGLGRMYERLEQSEQGKQIAIEALNLLERHAPEQDPALNKSRAHLASILFAENDIARAQALAARVVRACSSADVACARARAEANLTLSEVFQRTGRTQESLAAMQRSVVETATGYGKRSSEYAEVLAKNAIALRNAGEYVAASGAMEAALAIGAKQTLRKIERTRMSRTAALLDYDLGRYARARERLGALLAQTTNRAERGLQFRLLANVHLAEGNPSTARVIAERAIDQLEQAQSSYGILFAKQAHAQARSMLGDSEPALSEIQLVIDELHRIDAANGSLEALRAHRVRAEILLRAGRLQESNQELVALSAKLLARPERNSLELGQLFDLLGCVQRELGQLEMALESHRRAQLELQKILPNDHPFHTRNALYRLAASQDRAQLQAVAAGLELTPGSIWSVLIDAYVDASRCNAKGLAECTFVLW